MRRLNLSVSIQMWVVWVVAIGILAGVVVLITVLANPGMSYENTKAAIFVGFIFWILTGLSVWSYNGIVTQSQSALKWSRRRAIEVHWETEAAPHASTP